MTKQDFLDSLRHTLNGNMAAETVEENIRFYDSYFTTQMAEGRSEADILNELGDARILARTLIDAAERAGDAYAREANETQYRTAGTDTRTEQTFEENGREGRVMKLPAWLVALAVVLVLVAVVSIVGSLVWAVLPFLIPVFLVVWIVRLIRSQR